jgi:hypothetical protein
MMMDADQAALFVRATARVSAIILSANLIVAARRVGAPESGALRTNEARMLDIRLFVAFIVSHTIHFICVGLLTIATGGANIDARSGYTGVILVGIVFYIACAAVLRVKLRDGAAWTQPRPRHIEMWSLVGIWVAFFQAYITRPLQSWLFAALAIVLLYSVARFLSVALRGKGPRSELRSRGFAKLL